MFKKTMILLALASVSATSFAAPVANLKVTGSITPPTCTINGQDEVDVNYVFDISPGIFPASGNLELDPQVQPIEVVCDAATYLSFDATDNRDGTALIESNTTFGLGTYGDNETKVGSYTITMQDATVKANSDADAINVGVSNGSTYATKGVIDKIDSLAWATSVSTLVAGQIFAADFAVKPTINSVMKNSTGDAELDGHAVLAFAFGL